MNFLRSRRRKHSATSAAAAAAADDVTADSPVHVARDVTKSSASRVLTIDVYPSNHKHVVKVLPGLLLGSRQFALDNAALRCYHVTHIVNVTVEVADGFPTAYRYHRVAVTDSAATQLGPHLPAALRFIDASRAARGCVLVHCFYGHSRSASVVIAYLIRSQRMRYSDALQYLQMLRPEVQPNRGFERQLKEYERQRLTACDSPKRK